MEATEDVLGGLHALQAKILQRKVEEYLADPDSADPRVLQAVNAFLKQNNITAKRSNKEMEALLEQAKELPEFDDDNNVIAFTKGA